MEAESELGGGAFADEGALRAEVARLRARITAWEAVFDMSRSELIEAKETIRAQEQVMDLSRSELRVLRTDMERLVNVDTALEADILELLARPRGTQEQSLLYELERMRSRHGAVFSRDALRVLLNLNYDPHEADRLWVAAVRHHQLLSAKLGRDPGIAVSLLDYFKNVLLVVQSPKVIEISVFADMIRHAVVDELTGLYNRRFLGRVVERDMARAVEHGAPIAILVCDVDHFKMVNDTFGHPAGDQVLLTVARILLDHSRSQDATCRVGGEEFLVLAPDTTGKSAFLLAEKIRQAVEVTDFPVERQVTMSFGVASFPEFGPEFDKLLLAADGALYAAKDGGRNRTVLAQAGPGS